MKHEKFDVCVIIVSVIFLTIAYMTTAAKAMETQRYSSNTSENAWQQIEPGLEFGMFLSPQISKSGDSLVRVLRIDPRYFELRLLNASASEQNRLRTAKEWCQEYDLVSAINASMYQKDYRSSVSLMRTKEHVNNPRLSKDKTILAFDRTSSDVPLVKIIDRQCENFDHWEKKYSSLVQSIRMISCKGKNVWRQQSQKWSTALIAIDHAGKVLFIHVRSPYSTHDLINILLKLPLHILSALYTEGGREAQLYLRSGDHEYEFIGIRSTGFNAYNSARPIPNVIGVVKRDKIVEKD